MPIRDTNLYPSILAGQQQGARNALLELELGKDARTRSLLADYTMPGASREQKAANLELLLGANPGTAANVMNFEQAKAAAARQSQLEEAQRGLGMARFVATSEDPVSALAILDDDETIRNEATKLGLDTSDPDDVREIARMLTARYEMAAGPLIGDAERADPAIVREFRAFGIDPDSDEGRALYRELKLSGDGGLDALRLQLMGLDVKNRERELEQEERTEAESRASQQGALNRALEQTGKIADLTLDLEGSFLASGAAGSEWRRAGAGVLQTIANAAGIDTPELSRQINTFDQQKKNMADQLINLMSSGALGEATNAKLDQYRQALASPETGPGAIMAIQAQIARTLLDEADVKGFEVKNRDALEAKIDEMKAFEPGGGETIVDVPAAAARIAEIGRMSLDELEALGAQAADLSEEALEAAARRYEELAGDAR